MSGTPYNLLYIKPTLNVRYALTWSVEADLQTKVGFKFKVGFNVRYALTWSVQADLQTQRLKFSKEAKKEEVLFVSVFDVLFVFLFFS